MNIKKSKKKNVPLQRVKNDCFMDEFDLKGFSYREVDAYIWEAVKINQNFI